MALPPVVPPQRGRVAFTLAELLVVLAVLTLLAATQLPALTGGKASAGLTQCLNNLRQIGQAALLYKADNNDAYPYGHRRAAPGSGGNGTGWQEPLLRYLGGYTTNVQPMVYICPGEQRPPVVGWEFQLHYQANRQLLRDYTDPPIRGHQVRRPARYWMFSDKEPAFFWSLGPGDLANEVLSLWNSPPGCPGYRRHNGGMNSVAAEGHVEWLRLPTYQPGRPPPANFIELGDCSNGQNPGSTWFDTPNRVKLYSRESIYGFGGGGLDF